MTDPVTMQQMLFDQIQVAVAATDRASRIIYWNRYCETMYGWSREEALGRNFIEMLIPPERHSRMVALLERLNAGRTLESDVQVLCRDGSVISVRVTNSPLRDNEGNIIGYVGVSVDVTARLALERERERLLEGEKAARAVAEHASRTKDEFLATVSHELRTPLNAMMGWIYMLKSGRLDQTTRDKAIETIERNTRLQAHLIEDLLDVSRIIAGKLRLQVQQADLRSIINAALESLRPAAGARSIELVFSADPPPQMVLCDPDRMQQVIWNLVSNAIKFTPPGGSINLTLTRDDENILIVISDTGQGISTEFLPYVFDRFSQGESATTRSHGGIGLGLSIVRHLVELHGGRVTAQSDGPGKGAAFTVALPAAFRPQTSVDVFRPEDLVRLSEPETSSLRGVRVLVVEDDSDARELLRLLLEKYCLKVQIADSSAEALRLIRQQAPDILVSDIALPGSDGYDLIRQVRQLAPEQGRNIPAIALTACARDEDRALALAAGYQVHLTKPVEPAELTAVVASLVRQNNEV